MSDIDQLAQSIGAVAGKIDEAASVAVSAAQEAEEAAAVAEMLGSEPVVDTLVQVKDELDGLAAALEAASAEAGRIQASAMQVGKTSGGGGSVHVPAASADPSSVPSLPDSRNVPADKKRRRRRFRDVTVRASEKAEDVQDGVDTAAKAVQDLKSALSESRVRPPEPPKVSSTSSREQASPPSIGSAPGPGIEAPTIATAGIALGATAIAVREAKRRWRRAWFTPSQFPEGETPRAAGP